MSMLRPLHLLLLLFTTAAAFAQLPGIQLRKGQGSVDIPFEYQNNFIIVNLRFNRILPTRFIFDTGAEHTLLTKKELSDIMGVRYDREFKVLGSDLKTELTAYAARDIQLELPNGVSIRQDILVLGEDYFRFDEFTGLQIHGILGGDVFSRFIVRINYEARIITLYTPESFAPPADKYRSVPIDVQKGRAFLSARTRVDTTDIVTRLLLDSGANTGLLLYTNTHPDLRLPPNTVATTLGIGLGGDVKGVIGRIKAMQFGEFRFENLISSFQEADSLRIATLLNNRNGLLGNLLLERFSVIIDYVNGILYLRPNKNYNKEIAVDRSGLSLVASGPGLNVFSVQNLVLNSPAGEAGLLPGDVITRVNWWPASMLTLQDLVRIFQKKPGKTIRLSLKRNGKKMKTSFKLRDLI